MINLTENAVHVVRKMVKERKGYGLRVKKAEGCCSVLFDVCLDRKKGSDKIIKKHQDVHVFADAATIKSMKMFLRRKMLKPATIDYIKTHLGPAFFTDSHRISINIWEDDI